VDKIKLVIAVFISKSRNDATITVTDDRGVVSDCIYFIKFRGSLVPVSINREIKQRV
jgi:hypothetical protein